MTEAWKLAKDRIEVTQNHQKTQYNRCARPSTFAPGDRVFGYMLAARSGKAYKLAQPYHGPYRVMTSSDSTVEARPVDQLNASSIHVALDCIRVCRAEIPDVFRPGRTYPNMETTDIAEDMVPQIEWTGRLQPRPSCWTGSPDAPKGEM